MTVDLETAPPRSPLRLLLLLALLCTVGFAGPAAAQKTAKTPAKKAPAKSVSARVAEQKKQIDAQRLLIDEQRVLIETQATLADSQTVRVHALEAKLAELEAQLATMTRRLQDLESQAGLPDWETEFEKRLKEIEAASKKSPELPPDIVSAGDFPGSIRIPGTDAAIKFGGRIRTAVVLTLDPLGTDDRFLTNSIPVGIVVSGESRRTNISARASRLNIEFRTPSGKEQVRAFLEGDFAGEANAFRLRHAYAQYLGFIVGQTWSTFSDPWVAVEDLDFEGISSENVIRQPQVRYWWSPTANTRAAVAIETPLVSLTGGQGVNLVPDLIARLFWGQAELDHLQVAAVLREIRGEALAGDVHAAWAGGLSLSGVKRVNRWHLQDRILFQVNGGVGIGRYINDLNSLGGQDAVFDSLTGNLEALPAIGWYAALDHTWKKTDFDSGRGLRSTVLWSSVWVHNLVSQTPDAYHYTNRFVANLIYSPSGRVDLGLEYIYGTRINKDDRSGSANQIQIVTLFRF